MSAAQLAQALELMDQDEPLPAWWLHGFLVTLASAVVFYFTHG